MRDILGNDWDKIVVKSASYETTDPTINSQIVEAQNSGANVLLVAAIPKFAAQSIRKVYDSQLEADILHDQCGDLGRRRDHAGRTGEGGRHAQHRSI